MCPTEIVGLAHVRPTKVVWITSQDLLHLRNGPTFGDVKVIDDVSMGLPGGFFGLAFRCFLGCHDSQEVGVCLKVRAWGWREIYAAALDEAVCR